MKKIGLLICIFILILGAFFFNVFYIQQLYEIGIVNIVSLFNIELPLISYNAFIVIVFLVSCIYTGFKYKYTTDDAKEKIKLSYGTDEFNDGIIKFIGNIFGVILTKGLNLLILSILIGCLL